MGVLSKIFLGETIRETQEIYRSDDGKDRIFVGLFRNSISDVVWLKFWQKSPIIGSSGMGVSIGVDSFESFHDFLGCGCDNEGKDFMSDGSIPLILRLILRVNEGLIDARCMGEYRDTAASSNRVRIFTYINRKGTRRALFQYDNHFGSMDLRALEAIRDFVGGLSPAGLTREAVQSH